MGRTIKPKSGESRGAPGNARSVAANRNLTGRHLGSRVAAKFGVTVNINRQFRFAIAFLPLLGVATFVLYEVALAGESLSRFVGARGINEQLSGVRRAASSVYVNLPPEGYGPLTNSPYLRVHGQLDSTGIFQLVGINANWAGSYFHIEASTDLVNWSRVRTIYDFSPEKNGNGFLFTDVSSTSSSMRFYRVIDVYYYAPTPP